MRRGQCKCYLRVPCIDQQAAESLASMAVNKKDCLTLFASGAGVSDSCVAAIRAVRDIVELVRIAGSMLTRCGFHTHARALLQVKRSECSHAEVCLIPVRISKQPNGWSWRLHKSARCVRRAPRTLAPARFQHITAPRPTATAHCIGSKHAPSWHRDLASFPRLPAGTSRAHLRRPRSMC